MDTSRTRLIGLLALPMLLTLIGAACTSGATPAPTTVNVTLQEWAVVPSATSAAAGKITFTVKNVGPADPHEFVVIRTDLDAFALPTDGTGAAEEGASGTEVKGEIEDVAVGSTENLTLDLAAGHYTLICNVYSEEEKESHYKMGMAANFTVN